MFRFTGLLALLALPLHAEDVGRISDPVWIDELPIPELAEELKTSVEAGALDLVVDTQLAWSDGKRQSWWRHVITPVDRAGLEEVGTIFYTFDPHYEDLSLTRLHVIRDGQVIDLKDKVSVNVYRRELGLEDGIVDGLLTAVIEVPDVRVGDVLDYAFLSAISPVLPGDEYSVSADLEFGVPIGVSRYRVLWPKDQPMQVGYLPDRIGHTTETSGDLVIHTWRIDDAAPVFEPEMGAPGTWETAWLQAGTWDSWQPISDGFAPFYETDYPLTPDWDAKVAEIRAASNDPEVQAIAALRLVQDQIRYVGVEVGEGGYYARLPADVITKGYGDCKDKALLLKTVLRDLGIEAEVALADIEGWIRGDEVPSLYLFDHMILRAKFGDVWHYMDPTSSHQGGDLASAVWPDYGYVLPISGQQDQGLEPINLDAPHIWASDVTETYKFSFLGLFLTVRSEFRGTAADSWRWDWASRSHDDMSGDFLNYYAEAYPGLTSTADLVFTDDPVTNTVVIVESYFLPQNAEGRESTYADFRFQADAYADYYSDPDAYRTAPLWLGMARNQTWHVEVINAPLSLEAPVPTEIENDAFRFAFETWADDGGNMRLDWTYQTKTRLVPGEQAVDVLDDAAAMADYTSWTWDLTEVTD
jgi:transglutaminase-like putative cysteine protease